jgi:hypothetical protein
MRALARVLQSGREGLRTGVGDGAEVLDQLLARHADAESEMVSVPAVSSVVMVISSGCLGRRRCHSP